MEFWEEGEKSRVEDKQKLKNDDNADSSQLKSEVDELKKKIEKVENNSSEIENDEMAKKDKGVFGILLALFAGFPLGLIIGFMMYPPRSEERSSFIQAYWRTFLVCFLISMLVLISFLVYFNLLEKSIASSNITDGDGYKTLMLSIFR